MATTINPSDQSITQYNVQSGGANNLLNNISPSTSTFVLTSNGVSAQPTFQALPTGNVPNTTKALGIAYASTSQSNVTGDGTTANLILDAVFLDQASNYNTSTGVFTANTTGSYRFFYHIIFFNVGAAHTTSGTACGVPSHTFIGPYYNPFAISEAGFSSIVDSIIFKLNTNDQFTISVQIGGGTKTVGIQGGAGNIYTWLTWEFLG